MNSWASLFLRLGVGSIFIAHGAQQAFAAFGGPGIKAFSEMLSGLGFAPGIFWAYLAAYTELIGGVCLIGGVLTRPACIFLLIFILVATIRVHVSKGFFLSNGGYEYNLLIICALLAILLMGPGNFSINNKF